jgi:hypothetical protein
MKKIKNKKNFSLTKEAHEFAKDISSHAGNPSGVGQLAQLGFSIGITDDKHKKLESASKNIADTASIDPDGLILDTYINLFPEYDENVWFDIEKAASKGILIIKEKFYDEELNIINWTELYEEIS